MWSVYILLCADGTFYVGYTTNLISRENRHNDGFGSSYTAARRPVKLVFAEHHDSRQEAIARERELKRWSGKKKAALIAGNRTLLKQLSKRRPKARET